MCFFKRSWWGKEFAQIFKIIFFLITKFIYTHYKTHCKTQREVMVLKMKVSCNPMSWRYFLITVWHIVLTLKNVFSVSTCETLTCCNIHTSKDGLCVILGMDSRTLSGLAAGGLCGPRSHSPVPSLCSSCRGLLLASRASYTCHYSRRYVG